MPHPEKVNKDSCIVLEGNIADGFTAYGPFDIWDDAISYAEQNRLSDNWNVMPITTVQCDDKGNWVDEDE